jgi:hypothetical protein
MENLPDKPQRLLDGQLDRATDPEYAAVSLMAVGGLALGVLGALAYWVAPFLALSAMGVVVSLLALRKIRRSEGVLTGRWVAVAGAAIGAIVTVAGAAYHLTTFVQEHRMLTALEVRAFEVVDNLAADRYEQVYKMMPEEFRVRQASGPQQFRDRIYPLFKGAGAVEKRGLTSLRVLHASDGATVAPASIRVELERRLLDMTIWFKENGDGQWELVGVGGVEPMESPLKFRSEEAPITVPGPYEFHHEHHHDH